MDLSEFERKLLKSVRPPTRGADKRVPALEINEALMADHLEGRLPEKEAELVQDALALSPEWLEAVEVFLQSRRLPDEGLKEPPKAVTQRAQALFPVKRADRRLPLMEAVVRLAHDCLTVVRETADAMRYVAPAYAGVRSHEATEGANLVLLTKTMGSLTAELEVERVGDRMGEVTIRAREASGGLRRDVRVSLYDQRRELESQLASTGEVIFSDLNPGEYLFELTRENQPIGQIALQVSGEVQ